MFLAFFFFKPCLFFYFKSWFALTSNHETKKKDLSNIWTVPDLKISFLPLSGHLLTHDNLF